MTMCKVKFRPILMIPWYLEVKPGAPLALRPILRFWISFLERSNRTLYVKKMDRAGFSGLFQEQRFGFIVLNN